MISDFTGNMMVVVGGALFLLFGGILYANVQTSGLAAELAGECQVSDIPIPPLNEVSGSISCNEASLLKNTGLGTMGGGIPSSLQASCSRFGTSNKTVAEMLDDRMLISY